MASSGNSVGQKAETVTSTVRGGDVDHRDGPDHAPTLLTDSQTKGGDFALPEVTIFGKNIDKDGASVKELCSPEASVCSLHSIGEARVPLGPRASTQSHSSTANPEYYPMYVISVQDVLNHSGPLPPHQELLAQGKLVRFEGQKMLGMFVSHQWTGLQHPDPNGLQFKVLQEALRGVLDGRVSVETDATTQVLGFKKQMLSAAEVEDLRTRGYIWYDWFSVPQMAARTEGQDVGADLLAAVDSIPNYVERSAHFLILAPPVRHANLEEVVCDYTSWLSRGWCRVEMFARVLSSQKRPMVVVRSATEVSYMMSWDWVFRPAGEGTFTVASDRERVAPVMECLLEKRKARALEARDTFDRRVVLSLEAKLLAGLPRSAPVTNPVETFLAECKFHSPDDAIGAFGWRPLHFAAVWGGGAVESLLQGKASIEAKTKERVPFGVVAGETPLGVAAFLGPSSSISCLLAKKANVEAVNEHRVTPVSNASCFRPDVEPLRLLIAAKADLAKRNKFGVTPIHNAAWFSPNPEKLSILLDAFPSPGRFLEAQSQFGQTPLHLAAQSTGLAKVELLLERQADVDAVAQPWGSLGVLGAVSRPIVRCLGPRRSPGLARMFAGQKMVTPLMLAAYYGNLAVVERLLQARADPTRRNVQGLSALDWARWMNFEACVRLLEEHPLGDKGARASTFEGG